MFLRIDNEPRPYPWGSSRAIADLLGRRPSGGPEAELWLGGHVASPARIIAGADEPDLHTWAARHLPGGQLPFLFKVLAAASPLSLQVHPSDSQALAGFRREEELGLAQDDPRRVYRDSSAKPELLVALSSEFLALCGFRPTAEARHDLGRIADSRLEPMLGLLGDDSSLPDAVAWLSSRRPGVEGVIDALTEAAAHVEGGAIPSLRAVAILSQEHPGDPGVAIAMLMNVVSLRAGEAIFVPAGCIHAYLDGLGLELMAPSDNVVRGGLTSKHVDVTELMRIVDFSTGPAPLCLPDRSRDGVSVFRAASAGLELLLAEEVATRRGVRLGGEGPTVVLCLRGEIQLPDGSILRRGEAALCVDGFFELRGDSWVAAARRDHSGRA